MGRAAWTTVAVIAGAAVVVVGSTLPWVEVTAPFIGSFAGDGTEGDGRITLVLGAVVLLGLASSGWLYKLYMKYQ